MSTTNKDTVKLKLKEKVMEKYATAKENSRQQDAFEQCVNRGHMSHE